MRTFILALLLVGGISLAQETITFLDDKLPWLASSNLTRLILQLEGYEFLGETEARDYRFSGSVFEEQAVVVTNFNDRRQLVRIIVNFARFETPERQEEVFERLRRQAGGDHPPVEESEDLVRWAEQPGTDRETSLTLRFFPDDNPLPGGPAQRIRLVYESWAW